MSPLILIINKLYPKLWRKTRHNNPAPPKAVIFSAPEVQHFDNRSTSFLCILVLSCVSFCNSIRNFNHANNFSTMSARSLIFHMSISFDKNFPWIPTFLTSWPCHWSLTSLIKYEQWVLELWYFTGVFFMTRPFRWYLNCLTLWSWPKSLTYILENF